MSDPLTATNTVALRGYGLKHNIRPRKAQYIQDTNTTIILCLIMTILLISFNEQN